MSKAFAKLMMAYVAQQGTPVGAVGGVLVTSDQTITVPDDATTISIVCIGGGGGGGGSHGVGGVGGNSYVQSAGTYLCYATGGQNGISSYSISAGEGGDGGTVLVGSGNPGNKAPDRTSNGYGGGGGGAGYWTTPAPDGVQEGWGGSGGHGSDPLSDGHTAGGGTNTDSGSSSGRFGGAYGGGGAGGRDGTGGGGGALAFVTGLPADGNRTLDCFVAAGGNGATTTSGGGRRGGAGGAGVIAVLWGYNLPADLPITL